MIVVDAGHGGPDCGAIGASGLHEDDLNLSVAKCLQSVLIQNGAQVIMTREDKNAIAPTKDEDMEKRRQIIVESHSDIVVSIHMNSCTDPAVSGHIVFFMQDSPQGGNLAKAIDAGMDASLGGKSQNDVQPNDYFILMSGTQPCVIVECGFLSNWKEEAKLKNEKYQKQLGKAIFSGIIEYFDKID